MKEENQAAKEYRQAFDEFFKDKPSPKDEEETKKMLQEFFHWYNNVRKQSDTGKSPAQMYKVIYGEEAPDPVNIPDEEDLDQEEIESMKEFFDKKLWPNLKKDLKEATKKRKKSSKPLIDTGRLRGSIDHEVEMRGAVQA